MNGDLRLIPVPGHLWDTRGPGSEAVRKLVGEAFCTENHLRVAAFPEVVFYFATALGTRMLMFGVGHYHVDLL
jgi:hypothetical protein